jgi:PAS domain S-box-containing protein
MSDAALVVDLEGKTLYANPALENKFEFSKKELLGKHVLEVGFLDGLDESFREETRSFFEGPLTEEQELPTDELKLCTKKGTKGAKFVIELESL